MEHPGKANWEDSERVQRLVDTYSIRYDCHFWEALLRLTGHHQRDALADFGCGPGLFLVDAIARYKSCRIVGLDASEEMLKHAKYFLEKNAKDENFELKQFDFNKEPIPLSADSLDLAFSGFFLHEIKDPEGHVKQVYKLLREGGTCAIYDYISGNEEAFVSQMVEAGMDEERARMRYPHMCKHSIKEIETFLKTAGFDSVRSFMIEDMRAVVTGIKIEDPLSILEMPKGKSRKEHRLHAPWILDETAMLCPRCGSTKIVRSLDRWSRARGINLFECNSCGKKFYERGIDDLQPTFVR